MDDLMLPGSTLQSQHDSKRYNTISNTSNNNGSNFEQISCGICKKSFGVRKRHRRRTCRRCFRHVCDNCSTHKRFDFAIKQLVRTCDFCLKNEFIIQISHRINNLKLKSKRNKGIYIMKTLETSREYNDGFVTNCKIIEINKINVESFTAQQIANKLNIIKLPLKITLDYTEANIDIPQLKLLLKKKSLNEFDTINSSSIDSIRGYCIDDDDDDDDDNVNEDIDRQFCFIFNHKHFNLSFVYHSKYPFYWTISNNNNNIPIGSKLLSINGINMLNNRNKNKINKLFTECSLPLILLFEASNHLKIIPKSTHVQYTYTNKNTNNNNKILIWWLNDGGFIFVLLIFLGIILSKLHLLIIFIFLFIPSIKSFIFYWFVIKNNYNISNNIPFNIIEEEKEKEKEKEKHIEIIKCKKDINNIIKEEKEKEKEKEKIIEKYINNNWEENICNGFGSCVWGSYCLGSSRLLKVRGNNYLIDKIKINSKDVLFKIGHIEIFELHTNVKHIVEKEYSWFNQNKYKLPKHLFFFIFHLRLSSLNCSIVIYWYIDRNKYNNLIKTNQKISSISNEKGNDYFCIGSNGYDESGMFWNFINGECRFRNDRLKMIARKEEGSWYLHIPNTPAIVAKKIPILYYRAYNKKSLNSIKTYNTKSESYQSYNFKTLYNDNNNNNTNNELPCQCGKCFWIDNQDKYPEYLELYFNPESASTIARNTIKIAAGVTKSLSWELHFLLEGQRNNVELPETVFANARLKGVDLDSMIQID